MALVSLRVDTDRMDERKGTVTAAVTPSLGYDDARAGIDWLVEVLGFHVAELHEMPDGSVAHAELVWGTGLVFAGTRPKTEPWSGVGPTSLSLAAEDAATVDRLYDRARAADADIFLEMHEAPYGSHQFCVRDPGGNFWTVGTYRPQHPVEPARRP